MKIEKIQDKIVYSESTFTKRLIFSEEKVLNFVLNLVPGQEIPSHTHEESDLVLYVVTGKGDITIDGNTKTIEEGDIVYCVGKEEFYLKNNYKENLSCFVVLAPRPVPKIYADEVGK
ncbi:cupin domain-containing protein [Sporosalibacterium faouarense]|uniref:cupin domain-containing protein n=1 Tax=Sporosalibacterium faouarense TaxID=516123 RepID=UPI00141CD493|nr:cupin domain-containing protein [Sporosalibacterium faouarense]MTI48268.1 cupin domain-containing protein [Bacillota bacterium]